MFMKRKLIIEIISSLLILLFVYTAISKFLDYTSFKQVLSKSPLIGSQGAIVAIALPVTELFIAALLFMPRTKLWGLYSSFALMALFTLYLGYMIAFSPNLPCSCGGVLKQMTWNQHLVFNIFFTLLAFAGIVLNRKQSKRKQEEQAQVVYT
jgi:hypothetical protein